MAALSRHAFLAQSITDPQPPPARTAKRIGISARQLYRLFEAQGDSVCLNPTPPPELA